MISCCGLRVPKKAGKLLYFFCLVENCLDCIGTQPGKLNSRLGAQDKEKPETRETFPLRPCMSLAEVGQVTMFLPKTRHEVETRPT